MLEANKKFWFEKLFFAYNQNLLRRRFHSFQVSGFENLIKKKNEIPTVIYCNHSSWWDGLISFHLSRKADLDYFVMMEEKQLKDLQLFRKLGAFSVIRENPREAIISLKYAVKLLTDNPNRTLCLFPQGEILPNDVRPIKFYNGISRVVEKLNKCQIFCIAMRYEFLGKFKPEIFVSVSKVDEVGNSENFDSKKITVKLAEKLADNLDNLKNDILTDNLENYQNII